jgi:hypothetical protein
VKFRKKILGVPLMAVLCSRKSEIEKERQTKEK